MLPKLKTKKAFVFTIALLLLAATIFSLATLTSKLATDSRSRASDLTKFVSLYDADSSMQKSINTIFDTTSSIKINSRPGSVEFTQYLPPDISNQTRFIQAISNLETFVKSSNSKRKNITIDEFKIVNQNNLTLLIDPQNISYKEYDYNNLVADPLRRAVVETKPINDNSVNINKYQIKISSSRDISSAIWYGPPNIYGATPINPGTFPVVIDLTSPAMSLHYDVLLDPTRTNILNVTMVSGFGFTNLFIEVGFFNNYKMNIRKRMPEQIFTSVNVTLERLGNDYIDVTSLPGAYNITFQELDLKKISTVIYNRDYLHDECEIVANREIAGADGNVNVACPAGKFVTGCGARLIPNPPLANLVYIKEVYPTSTNVCFAHVCNNDADLTTYAICCSRLKTQVIGSGVQATGSTTIKCNPGQYLLGCGGGRKPWPNNCNYLKAKYQNTNNECFASMVSDCGAGAQVQSYATCNDLATFRPCFVRKASGLSPISVSCLKGETLVDCGGNAIDPVGDNARLTSVYPSSSNTCTAEAKVWSMPTGTFVDAEIYATCCLT